MSYKMKSRLLTVLLPLTFCLEFCSCNTVERGSDEGVEKVAVTLENIMLSCHLSKKMAENIVIFLCSMGLLEFKYDAGMWLLTTNATVEQL